MKTIAEARGNELYMLLREGDIEAFNKKRPESGPIDLSDLNLRGLDLKGMNTDGIKFDHSYFRGSDLRGVDFRNATLNGASVHEAKISGVYFPDELTAAEIRMSVHEGTRMRYR